MENILGFGGFCMKEANFNGPNRAGPKIVSCLCRATVPRVRPRPGSTIRPGQPEVLSLSCRAIIVSCFFGPFSCRPIGPGPSGHLYPHHVPTCATSKHRPQ
jgi:hypothetical protein